jgi:hypothetical protein
VPPLPLDHPEPFLATLGVMLYPGTDNDDPSKARAFAAQWLSKPFSRYCEAGHKLPYESLARIVSDGGELLNDLDDRFWGGTATGEMLKTVFALSNSDPRRVSWNNAVKIFELVASRHSVKGSRAILLEAKRRFLPVAHLWAAWCIREGQFRERPDVKYDGFDDFQSFLTEAEILRSWAQTWQPPRAKSSPLLPMEMWQVPATWRPPVRLPGWPNTSVIPSLKLPDDLLAVLAAPGRPRKADNLR